MGGGDLPVYRWHEPAAPTSRVLLLGTAAAGLLALAVVTLVVDNWDVAIISGALGVAAAADLWGDLRRRSFVLAGDDGLVVGHRRRTTVVPWADVEEIHVQRRRLGRDRAVVRRAGGVLLPLPHDVSVDELVRRRPGTA